MARFVARIREEHDADELSSRDGEFILLTGEDGAMAFEFQSGSMREDQDEMRGCLGFPIRLGRSVVRDRRNGALFAYAFAQNGLDGAWRAGGVWKSVNGEKWAFQSSFCDELLRIVESGLFLEQPIEVVDERAALPFDVADYVDLREGTGQCEVFRLRPGAWAEKRALR